MSIVLLLGILVLGGAAAALFALLASRKGGPEE
jgi:hypothetical protein